MNFPFNYKKLGQSICTHFPLPDRFKRVGALAGSFAYNFVATLVHPINTSSADHVPHKPSASISLKSSFSPLEELPEIPEGYVEAYPGLSISEGLISGVGGLVAAHLLAFENNASQQAFNDRKIYFKRNLGPSGATLAEGMAKFAANNAQKNLVSTGLPEPLADIIDLSRKCISDVEGATLEELSHIQGIFKDTSPWEFTNVLREVVEFLDDYLEAKQYIQERAFDDLTLDTVREERKAWIEGFAKKWHFIVPEDPEKGKEEFEKYLRQIIAKFKELIYSKELHLPFRNLIDFIGMVTFERGFQPMLFKRGIKLLDEVESREGIYCDLYKYLDQKGEEYRAVNVPGFEQPNPLADHQILVDFIGGLPVVRACSNQAKDYGIFQGMEASKAQYLYDNKADDGSYAELLYRKDSSEAFKGYPTLEDLFGKLISEKLKFIILSKRKDLLLKSPKIGIPITVTLEILYMFTWPLRKLLSLPFAHTPSIEQLGKDFASNSLFLLRFPGLKVLFIRMIAASLNCLEPIKDRVQYEELPIQNPKRIFSKTLDTTKKFVASFFPKISKFKEASALRVGGKVTFWITKKVCVLTIAFLASPIGNMVVKVIHLSIISIPKIPFIGKRYEDSIDSHRDFIDDGFALFNKTIQILNGKNNDPLEKLQKILSAFYLQAAKMGLVDPNFEDFRTAPPDFENLFEEFVLLSLKIFGEYFDPMRLDLNDRVDIKKVYLEDLKDISLNKQRIRRSRPLINKLLEEVQNYQPGVIHSQIVSLFDSLKPVLKMVHSEFIYLNNQIENDDKFIQKINLFHQSLSAAILNPKIDQKKILELVEEQLRLCEEEHAKNEYLLRDEILKNQINQLLMLKKELKKCNLFLNSQSLLDEALFNDLNSHKFIACIKDRLMTTKDGNDRAEDTYKYPIKDENFRVQVINLVEQIRQLIPVEERLTFVDLLFLEEKQQERAQLLTQTTVESRAWAKDMKWQYSKEIAKLRKERDHRALLRDNFKTFLLPDGFFGTCLTADQQTYLKDFLKNFDLKQLEENYLMSAQEAIKLESILYPEGNIGSIQKNLNIAEEELANVKKENTIYFQKLLANPKIKDEIERYFVDNSFYKYLKTTVYEATTLDPIEREKVLFSKGMIFLKDRYPHLLKTRLMKESHIKWKISDLSKEIVRLKNQGMKLKNFDVSYWLNLSGPEAFDQLLARGVHFAKEIKPYGLFA